METIDSPSGRRVAGALIKTGVATGLGLTVYIIAHQLGYGRHLARRVKKLSLLGFGLGALGGFLRYLQKKGTGPAEPVKLTTLFPDHNLDTCTPRQIAKGLETGGFTGEGYVQALKVLIREREILHFSDKKWWSKRVCEVTLDPGRLLGEGDWNTRDDTLFPPLLAKAFVTLIKEEGDHDPFWGTHVDLTPRNNCAYGLEKLLPLMEQMEEIENLTLIKHSVDIQTESQASAFSDLVDRCPKLIRIPMVYDPANLHEIFRQTDRANAPYVVALRAKVKERADRIGMSVAV